MTELPLDAIGLSESGSSEDNRQMFQAALDQVAAKTMGGRIIVPGGRYRCAGGLTFKAGRSLVVSGEGRASRIDFVSGVEGLGINTQGESAVVQDVQLNAMDTSAAFERIVGIKSLARQGSRVDRCAFHTLGDAAPTVGIDVGQTERFMSNDCFGQLGGGALQAGYAADNAGALYQLVGEEGVGTDHRIVAARANLTGSLARIRTNGVTGSPKLEGVVFRDCTGVGVARGFDVVGEILGDYRAPMFQFLGGHINAALYGVFCANVSQVRIEDVLVYTEGFRGGAPFFLKDVIDFDVANNRIYNLAPTDLGAIVIDGGSNGGSIAGNFFQGGGNSAMINLRSNVINTDVSNNTFRRTSGGGDVLANLGGPSNRDQGGNGVI